MEKQFLDGLIAKKPGEKAPQFIITKLSFKVEEFIKTLQELNKNNWVNVEIRESRQGKYYAIVDEYKPSQETSEKVKQAEKIELNNEQEVDIEDLPF